MLVKKVLDENSFPYYHKTWIILKWIRNNKIFLKHKFIYQRINWWCLIIYIIWVFISYKFLFIYFELVFKLVLVNWKNKIILNINKYCYYNDKKNIHTSYIYVSRFFKFSLSTVKCPQVWSKAVAIRLSIASIIRQQILVANIWDIYAIYICICIN